MEFHYDFYGKKIAIRLQYPHDFLHHIKFHDRSRSNNGTPKKKLRKTYIYGELEIEKERERGKRKIEHSISVHIGKT